MIALFLTTDEVIPVFTRVYLWILRNKMKCIDPSDKPRLF
jgi:hypothetical protein